MGTSPRRRRQRQRRRCCSAAAGASGTSDSISGSRLPPEETRFRVRRAPPRMGRDPVWARTLSPCRLLARLSSTRNRPPLGGDQGGRRRRKRKSESLRGRRRKFGRLAVAETSRRRPRSTARGWSCSRQLGASRGPRAYAQQRLSPTPPFAHFFFRIRSTIISLLTNVSDLLVALVT